MKKIIIALSLIAATFSGIAQNVPVWRDSSKSFEERAEDLLSRLTPEEKLRFFSSDIPAIERLGIRPYMWYGEALHGMLTWGATSFPQNNAMGSTWDKDLMFDVANAISDEARALQSSGRGEVMMYSPTVNMARDPRWGRNEECYSEDPYHMTEMARMYVRGMQGTHPKYLKTVCTVKHYVANNVEHKREQLTSEIEERDLREYYFPAYKALVVEERAGGIMSALNGLKTPEHKSDIIACSGHDWLLNTVLRDEWGFKGYVVADWAAVGSIHRLRREKKTNAEAAVAALKAGCDQECFRPKESPMVKGLIEAYENGMLKEEDMDEALLRLLRLRFMVNGFNIDDECPYNNTPKSLIQSDENNALALKAAEKTIVLLKNEENILPLKESVKSVAVVGPFADRCWLGIYSGKPSKNMVSPLQGIKSRFKGEVLYAEGCKVTDKEDDVDMSAAIAAAKKAEVVVAFVGNDETTATENRDRTSITLPGRQQKLLDELCKVNDNVIVVIVPSGATTIGAAQEDAKGVLVGWANGQQQGTAIAKVLFGDTNPGGKLNTTWFASDSDLPHIWDYNVRNNRTYMYFKGEALYPFGYGLSYTTFKLSKMKLESKKLEKGGSVKVSVMVSNTGEREGDEVVQLYIKDNATPSAEAKKMLKGFERVSLKAGESKRVEFTLDYDAFQHWDVAKKAFAVSEGSYDIMIGNSSANTPLKAKIKAEGSVLPEHSFRTHSYADYHKNERYHSKYYGGKVVMPKVAAPAPKKKEEKKPAVWVGPRWIEYLVNFVDPGFYVSEWTIKLNYTAPKAQTKASLELDGVMLHEKVALKKAGKASQSFTIPKPEYTLPTRVRFYVEPGVDVHSIDVVWPKDDSLKNYNDPVGERM